MMCFDLHMYCLMQTRRMLPSFVHHEQPMVTGARRKSDFMARYILLNIIVFYRASHLLVDLGWVDFDPSSSCQISISPGPQAELGRQSKSKYRVGLKYSCPFEFLRFGSCQLE